MAFFFPKEDENRVKQVEERRVIYIGRISEGTTKAELRARFEKYGTIVDISVPSMTSLPPSSLPSSSPSPSS